MDSIKVNESFLASEYGQKLFMSYEQEKCNKNYIVSVLSIVNKRIDTIDKSVKKEIGIDCSNIDVVKYAYLLETRNSLESLLIKYNEKISEIESVITGKKPLLNYYRYMEDLETFHKEKEKQMIEIVNLINKTTTNDLIDESNNDKSPFVK